MDQSPTIGGVAVDLQVQAQRAAAAGLVRVNGLPLWQFGDFGRDVMYVVEPLAKECGHWYDNNSRFVLITREGNAWWGTTRCSEEVRELRRDFCGEYGIEKGFANVPASNAEEFYPDHLVDRLADPYALPRRGLTRAF